MKILFVSHYAGSYGANRSMVDLAKELQLRGHDILVVVPRQGQVEALLRRSGVRYKILYHRPWVVEEGKSLISLRRLAARLVNLVADVRLFALGRGWKPDLVHVNSSCTPVGFRSSQWLGVPLVWHIREYLEEDYQLRFLDTDQALNAFRKADRVIAVSQDVARKYQALIGNHLGVVYNGVEQSPGPARRILSNNNRLEILMVGALAPGKGHVDALRSIRIARDELGVNVRLRIVGSGDTSYEKRLHDLASEWNLGGSVEFHGYIEDTAVLRNESDIGLVCSEREAFGRVTIEAMTSGLLVVASRSGGTSEIVQDHQTGLLYQPANPEHLASLFAWVSANRSAARKIAAQGRDHCAKFFSIGRVANDVLGVYENCLTSHRSSPPTHQGQTAELHSCTA